MERRHLLEGLHHQDEDVEVFGDHRRNHVNPAPPSHHVEAVAREQRDRQYHERDDPDLMARRDVGKGEKKAGHTGQHRGQQKERGPAIEPFGREQSEQNDQPRSDAYQADDHVHRGKRRERPA